MRIDEILAQECVGCMECVFICPVNCIEFKHDNEGFRIPSINQEKCINCSMCYVSCPITNNFSIKQNSHMQMAYGLQCRDETLLKNSSSGGAASIISKTIIEQGGVVYGAVLDEDKVVRHCRVDLIADISRLSGSKYVQSEFDKVFETIKSDLQKKIPVAVFGTPCQIFSLRCFLGEKYEKLYLIDLICHGTPSPLLFKKYLQWKEKRLNDGKIQNYRFRDKGFNGWDTAYKITTANKTEAGEATKDPYYFSFIYAQTYRESCYRCQFSNTSRCGDITLGDFWGIEKTHSSMAYNKEMGYSAVICNTQKGYEMVRRLKNKGSVYLFPSSVENIARENANLAVSAERPKIRDIYYVMIEARGFKWAMKSMITDRRYYTEKLKRMIPKKLKTKIKKVLSKRI